MEEFVCEVEYIDIEYFGKVLLDWVCDFVKEWWIINIVCNVYKYFFIYVIKYGMCDV